MNWKSAISKNWKTSTIGILGMGFSFVTMFPDRFGGSDSWVVMISKFAIAGGFAALGIAAKDYDTTGK